MLLYLMSIFFLNKMNAIQTYRIIKLIEDIFSLRHYPEEDEFAVLAFSDVTLGPGKAAFQASLHANKTKISIPAKQNAGYFVKINRSFTSLNFVKMVEKLRNSADKVIKKLTSLRTNKITIKDCEVNTIS